MIEINLINVTNFGNTGLTNHTDINMWTSSIFILQPESLTAQIRHIFQKAHQINFRVFLCCVCTLVTGAWTWVHDILSKFNIAQSGLQGPSLGMSLNYIKITNKIIYIITSQNRHFKNCSNVSVKWFQPRSILGSAAPPAW